MGGNTPNVGSILSSLNSVMALLQTGALKTARSAMQQAKNGFILYVDIFDYAIEEITIFLTERGYN
jgi:hypothetical protein